jgi:hypothetical protein
VENTEVPALQQPLEPVSKHRVVVERLRLLEAFQDFSARERRQVIEEVDRRRTG